jgi:hypothetical protein
MNGGPYVYERQTEYWTSRQLEEFFLDIGFEILTFPLTPFSEKFIPTDFIFFDKNLSKIFGFQYKTIYHNDKDFWKLDKDQHNNLGKFPWIYYFFSEIRRARDHRASLHLARITTTDFSYRSKIYLYGDDKLEYYMRWVAFYNKLEKCKVGKRVTSRSELSDILAIGKPYQNTDNLLKLIDLMADVFLADYETKHMVHLSSVFKDGHKYK